MSIKSRLADIEKIILVGVDDDMSYLQDPVQRAARLDYYKARIGEENFNKMFDEFKLAKDMDAKREIMRAYFKEA